jgi:hypothetical protein
MSNENQYKVKASWNKLDIQDLSSMNEEQEKKIKKAINDSLDIWEYNQIIDGVYKNYLIEDSKVLPNMLKEKMTEMGFRLTKEEFINKCKTDSEFSKRWGLKIEERELSWKERRDIAEATMDKLEFNGYFNEEKGYWVGFGHISPFTDWAIHAWLNSKNIPTKLITITYNDKTIESYE